MNKVFEGIIGNIKLGTFSRCFFIFVQILTPVFFGLYSVWLGQDINWDIQNYHLYNPYAFLNNRIDFDLAPAGLQTYFNPLLDIFYYLVITTFSPKTFAFILGVLHGLNFVLLFNICALCLKDTVLKNKLISLFLAILGILSAGFLSEIGTTLGDNLVSLFVLFSLYLTLVLLKLIRTDKIKWAVIIAIIAGFVVGAGAGIKLTTAIYVLALPVAFIFSSFPWRKKGLFVIILGVGIGIGFLITGGAWHYHMWKSFGNPLFPTYNDTFKGELVQDLPVKDNRFMPKNTFDKIFYPAVFTVQPLKVAELEFKQISWIFLYLILLLFFVNRSLLYFKQIQSRVVTPEIRYLLFFSCTAYLLWLNIFGIYRYLITIEMMIPLIIFSIFIYMFNEKWVQIGVIFVIIFITLFNLHGIINWGHSEWSSKSFYTSPSIEYIKQDSIGSAILIGQPLAWLIPVLNMNVPFIQILPNMPVSEKYWQKANSIIKDNGINSLIIYDEASVNKKNIEDSLKKINVVLDLKKCRDLDFYLGSQKLVYKFCIN